MQSVGEFQGACPTCAAEPLIMSDSRSSGIGASFKAESAAAASALPPLCYYSSTTAASTTAAAAAAGFFFRIYCLCC